MVINLEPPERSAGSRSPSAEDVAERLADMQAQLEDARDRATDAEMECESLRKQLADAKSKANIAPDLDTDEIEERLADMQARLEDARDKATDAEMECESLRKQLADEKSTSKENPTPGMDDDYFEERLADMQRQLDDARDKATDAEMECESLRKQLADEKATSKENPTPGMDDDYFEERLADMQRQLDDARDKATDAEMECESLRKQLADEKATSKENPTPGIDGDYFEERLADMQRQLDDARDKATDAEMECESLRKQLADEKSTSKELPTPGMDGDYFEERLADMIAQLDDARDKATDAEMECESLRKQLADEKSTSKELPTPGMDGDYFEERLAGMQRQLDDARDKATDAEMECESLRKQLADEKSTSKENPTPGIDGDYFEERLADMQRQLDDARDKATDAEMECESLRKQLADEKSTSKENPTPGIDGDYFEERLADMQRQLDDARDKATDAEMECESLRKQLADEKATSKENPTPGMDGDYFEERLADMQAQLDDARDKATDAEMECESLRKQLAEERAANKKSSEDGLKERLLEMQQELEEAWDRAADLEVECDLLKETQQEQAWAT